jgi:hypothetical protein
MTIPVYSGTVPNTVQSQPEFDANTQEFIDYMAALAPALNDFAETISSVDTTSTSTSSVSIGTGTKNFTVETGKSYFVGMSLKIANTATNYMVGDVISYNSGTGALSVNVVAISGTGTYSSWTLTVAVSGIVDTSQIANGAVTENKIGNNAVTTNKINNLAVTTAKINNAAVDATKITTTLFNELTTTAPAAGDLIPFADISASNVNRNATAENVVKAAINASGSAPVYGCRAWVNFNGTTSPPTIRASGNVSSVTKNGTGDYTINFTTAMPDANYAPLFSASYAGSGSGMMFEIVSLTSSAARIRFNTTSAAGDPTIVSFSAFR